MTRLPRIFGVILAALMAMAGAGVAQNSSHELEERALEFIGDRLQSVSIDHIALRRTIEDFERLAEVDLNAIERFKRHYYTAYLHYVSGLVSADAGQNEAASSGFHKAQGSFDLAYRKHREEGDNIRLPKHQVFAKFMISWCQIRRALLPGTDDDDALLRQSLLNLQEVEAAISAAELGSFLQDDIHFMSGYCYYLQALREYYTHRIASGRLDTASAIFGTVGSTSAVWELTDFFMNLTSYLRMQEDILHTSGQVSDQEQRLQAVQDYFRDLAARSDSAPELQAHARFNYNMALMQQDIGRYLASTTEGQHFQLSRPEALPAGDVRQTLVMNVYRRFLDYLVSGSSARVTVADELPESRFWRDLVAYTEFVNGNTLQLPGFSLPIGQMQEPHAASLGAQADYFRGQRSIFAAAPTPIANMPSGLFDSYAGERRECYVFGWNAQIQRFDLANTFARLRIPGRLPDFQTFNSVEHWLATVGNRHNLAGWLGVDSPLSEDDAARVRALANFLRTVGKHRYSYLLYSFLKDSGVNADEMVLLQTFCLFQSGEFESALARLAGHKFNTLTNRNESRYYRGRILQDFYYVDYDPAEAEYNRIRDVDPRAALLLMLQFGSNEDTCRAWSQANNGVCMDGIADQLESMRDAELLCESTSAVAVVGRPDVRLDLLLDARKAFNIAEKQQLLKVWQVYSRPLHILRPDRETGMLGPREFFLQTDIDVVFRFDDAAQRRLLIPSESVDTTFSDKRVIVRKLKSSKPYTYIVSQTGRFPLIADAIFTRNAQEVFYQSKPAVEISGAEPAHELAGVQVVAESDGIIVANDLRTPLFELRRQKTLRRIVGHDASDGHSYNALAGYEGGYLLASRTEGEIFAFPQSGGAPTPLFADQLRQRISDPVGLVAEQNDLFVADAATDSIFRVDATTGIITAKTSDAQLKSIGSLAIVGSKARTLFVADWKAGSVYLIDLDLRNVVAACGVRPAQDSGMIAPYRVDSAGEWALVSDLIAKKIFVFDRSGEFITSFDIKNNSAVNAARYGENSLSLFTNDGILKYAMVPDPDYEFHPCDTGVPRRAVNNLATLEASRF